MLQNINIFRSLEELDIFCTFFTLQQMYKPQMITQHHTTTQHTVTIWAGYKNLHELTLWNCLDPSKSAVLWRNSFMESSYQIFSFYFITYHIFLISGYGGRSALMAVPPLGEIEGDTRHPFGIYHLRMMMR